MVLGRQLTHWVGGGWITSHQERLTTTPTEIDLPLVTTPAGLWHPIGPTKPFEYWRINPDVLQRIFCYVWKFEPRDLASRLTRQHEPVWRDAHGDHPPSLQTRFRVSIEVVVWQHVKNIHPTGPSCACLVDHRMSLIQLFPRRHQGSPISERPPSVLCVR
jgi:hypothetical protein